MWAIQALFTLFLRHSQRHTLPSHDPKSLLQLLPSHPHCSQQEGEKGTRGHTLSLKVMACELHVKLPPTSQSPGTQSHGHAQPQESLGNVTELLVAIIQLKLETVLPKEGKLGICKQRISHNNTLFDLLFHQFT